MSNIDPDDDDEDLDVGDFDEFDYNDDAARFEGSEWAEFDW